MKDLYFAGYKPKEIQAIVGISERQARRLMFRMRAQIDLTDYAFSPQVRRDIANSALTKTVIENINNGDVRGRKIAMDAAKAILKDKEVQQLTEPKELDVTAIEKIGGGKVIDISRVLAPAKKACAPPIESGIVDQK